MPKQKDPNHVDRDRGLSPGAGYIWCRRADGAAGSMEPASPTIIRLRLESKAASRNADGFAFVPHPRRVLGRAWLGCRTDSGGAVFWDVPALRWHGVTRTKLSRRAFVRDSQLRGA